jgi:hypothetical protein
MKTFGQQDGCPVPPQLGPASLLSCRQSYPSLKTTRLVTVPLGWCSPGAGCLPDRQGHPPHPNRRRLQSNLRYRHVGFNPDTIGFTQDPSIVSRTNKFGQQDGCHQWFGWHPTSPVGKAIPPPRRAYGYDQATTSPWLDQTGDHKFHT